MLVELDINKHNFSKIGKYISNKLHHIHKKDTKKRQSTASQPLTEKKDSTQQKAEVLQEKKAKTARKKEQWLQPSVGTYRVSYSSIDRNMHLYNFNRSTPHFYNQKHRAHEVTPLTKEYPDGLQIKNKGFMELKRMVGREEIKGSIRKNLQNPHQARFQTYRFPNLALDSKGVSFCKMSQRKNVIDSRRVNGAEYDCDFQVKMKRLDSHIIPFKKQTSRPDTIFEPRISPDRCELEEMKVSVDKSVQWSKQLSREVDGILPGYMQKSVNSRMAMSNINLKTLEMNCTDLKDRKKLKRHLLNSKSKMPLGSSAPRQI